MTQRLSSASFLSAHVRRAIDKLNDIDTRQHFTRSSHDNQWPSMTSNVLVPRRTIHMRQYIPFLHRVHLCMCALMQTLSDISALCILMQSLTVPDVWPLASSCMVLVTKGRSSWHQQVFPSMNSAHICNVEALGLHTYFDTSLDSAATSVRHVF
jgi:hypothetical protein